MDILTLIDKFFTAIENKDTDTVADIYGADAKIWHNFTNRIQSKAENLKTLQGLCDQVPELHYDIIERHQLSASRVVQRHILRAVSAAEEVCIPACIFIEVADNKIIQIEEYLDTGQTKKLMNLKT
ncbi:MAG: nuclear transport factor 2 family protein [Pseudomonadales bacterium]|nr:nuclear transport factor 2 family protein [Pseudomonadales bacterium]